MKGYFDSATNLAYFLIGLLSRNMNNDDGPSLGMTFWTSLSVQTLGLGWDNLAFFGLLLTDSSLDPLLTIPLGLIPFLAS